MGQRIPESTRTAYTSLRIIYWKFVRTNLNISYLELKIINDLQTKLSHGTKLQKFTNLLVRQGNPRWNIVIEKFEKETSNQLYCVFFPRKNIIKLAGNQSNATISVSSYHKKKMIIIVLSWIVTLSRKLLEKWSIIHIKPPWTWSES